MANHEANTERGTKVDKLPEENGCERKYRWNRFWGFYRRFGQFVGRNRVAFPKIDDPSQILLARLSVDGYPRDW